MKRRQTQEKTKRSRTLKAKNFSQITTVEQFFALSQQEQEIQIAVANAITLMRSDKLPLSMAARASGIPPKDLIRRGRSALRKQKNGRYAVNAHDDLFRVVIVVSESKGPIEVATNDSRKASKAGKHSAAVQRYLETGDDSALQQFAGHYILDAQGNRIALLTDEDELDRLGSAGELSFESLYARSR
jgi:hypothetical protein